MSLENSIASSSARRWRFEHVKVLTQGGQPVLWSEDSGRLSWRDRLRKASRFHHCGPTHRHFNRFLAAGIAGQGLMFLAMSIGTSQFLACFTAAGNPVSWWLAKDILPAFLSVLSVSYITPERNVARWYVVSYAATNAVIIAEFVLPGLIASGSQPFAGVVTSLAKSITHMILQVCRAGITEQYAQGNNFAAMMRAFTSAGTMAFAIGYGVGLLLVHHLSWTAQLAVMSSASFGSIACAAFAVKGYAPQKVSLDIARVMIRDFDAVAAFDRERFRPLGPENFAAKYGVSVSANDVLDHSMKVIANVSITAVASSRDAFLARFEYFPQFRAWIGYVGSGYGTDGPKGGTSMAILYHDDATLTDVLAGLVAVHHFLLLAAASTSPSSSEATNAAAPLVSSLLRGAGAQLLERCAMLAKELEELLQSAEWLASGDSIAPRATRVRLTSSAESDSPPP